MERKFRKSKSENDGQVLKFFHHTCQLCGMKIEMKFRKLKSENDGQKLKSFRHTCQPCGNP